MGNCPRWQGFILHQGALAGDYFGTTCPLLWAGFGDLLPTPNIASQAQQSGNVQRMETNRVLGYCGEQNNEILRF